MVEPHSSTAQQKIRKERKKEDALISLLVKLFRASSFFLIHDVRVQITTKMEHNNTAFTNKDIISTV